MSFGEEMDKWSNEVIKTDFGTYPRKIAYPRKAWKIILEAFIAGHRAWIKEAKELSSYIDQLETEIQTLKNKEAP